MSWLLTGGELRDLANDVIGIDVIDRCDRATTIRDVLGTWGIQISTGGGTDLPTSLQSQFFRYAMDLPGLQKHLFIMPSRSCSDLQIIALHDYNLDPSYVASHVDPGKSQALASGKRLLYEEFGALGSDKQSQISTVVSTLISVRDSFRRCSAMF